MKKILSSAVIFTVTALASAMTMANEHQHHHDAHHEHHQHQSATTHQASGHHGHHGHHHEVRADGHAPAGVMFDHMHGKGSLMLGYNAQRMLQNGGYYQGSALTATNDLSRYSMLTDKHEMYMHMLHVMYGVTDNITLSVMPMYMSMDMDMRANPNFKDTSSHSGHGHSHGHGHNHGSTTHHGSHSHGVEGWGDTILGATYRLYENDKHSVLTTLAVSAPTGNAKKKGDDGKPVHYGMQLGAGVWQVLPNITYQYKEEKVKAGVQISARQPLKKRNDWDYYQGDQLVGTAWVSYAWHPKLSTSVRAEYTKTDKVQGHYNVSHHHNAPADFQRNYGGTRTSVGLGVNTVLPMNIRLGVEYMKPVYEKVNGVQQHTDNTMNLSISKAF